MTKHTPGPWDVHTNPLGCEIHQLKDEHGMELIADMPFNECGGMQKTEANARLIAAAPELLEALKLTADLAYELAMSNPKLCPKVDRIIPLARAAIAKATQP